LSKVVRAPLHEKQRERFLRYLMRLVRQRDELKQVTKMAEARARPPGSALGFGLGSKRPSWEERDSYHILGLHGPSCSEDEARRGEARLIDGF